MQILMDKKTTPAEQVAAHAQKQEGRSLATL